MQDDLSTRWRIRALLSADYMSAPPARQWRTISNGSSPSGMPFTLMCYNVLCPKYATTHMYPYCPTWALSWDYRQVGILEEIGLLSADIVCLQELETEQYDVVFRTKMEQLNYQSVFLPKSRRRTMGESDSKNVDGCAIFWKADKFDKVHEFHHEFMLSCTNLSVNPAPTLVNRVMNRDNVALGVIFQAKDPNFANRKLCVTTGHIHWDPQYSDVKLVQTILWTTELWHHIEQYLQVTDDPSDPSEMPVILCGDLNSLPESGVVDFLLSGRVDRAHTEFREMGTKYLFEEWKNNLKTEGTTLRHRFLFDRAYKEEQGMKWSNYTSEFKGMIDYVFFSKAHLRLLSSLDQIDESWLQQAKIVGCPHIHNYSDHFSLLVNLELLPSDRQLPDGSKIITCSRPAHAFL